MDPFPGEVEILWLIAHKPPTGQAVSGSNTGAGEPARSPSALAQTVGVLYSTDLGSGKVSKEAPERLFVLLLRAGAKCHDMALTFTACYQQEADFLVNIRALASAVQLDRFPGEVIQTENTACSALLQTGL